MCSLFGKGIKQRETTVLLGLISLISFSMGHSSLEIQKFWCEPLILWMVIMSNRYLFNYALFLYQKFKIVVAMTQYARLVCSARYDGPSKVATQKSLHSYYLFCLTSSNVVLSSSFSNCQHATYCYSVRLLKDYLDNFIIFLCVRPRIH